MQIAVGMYVLHVQGLTELKQVMFEELTDDERQCACCQTTLFLSAAVCPCTPSV